MLTDNAKYIYKNQVNVKSEDINIEKGVVAITEFNKKELLDANAIVDPLAMMVKSFNAPVTHIAVSRFSCADDFACWTEHVGVEFFN